MAKDDNDLNYDDIDDFDLDIPEIDVDPEQDTRSPVRKLSTGFAQGVKDDLTDRRDAPRKIKAILPPKYSSSIDVADETLGTVGNLYNTLRDETKTGAKSLRKAARSSIGKHTDKMPKWLGSRIDSLLGDDEEERQAPTVQDQRDVEIENTLGNIFKLQVERDENEGAEEEARQTVREVLEGKRHETQVEQLYGIRQDVHRQVDYQDKVTARFQRKSLEMQYRQYFLTKDLLSVSETSSKDIKEALQSIVKNTSLPEYRKIELTEAVGQQFRDRLTGGIQNKISDLSSGFLGRASQSLTGAFKEKAQGWNEQMQSAAGMANMVNDASGMIDPHEQAGSTVGGVLSSQVFQKAFAPMMRRMGMDNQKLREGGEDAEAFVKNLPRAMNEWIRDNEGGGGIAGFIAESVGSAKLDNNLSVDGIESSLDPAIFDRQTRQSIVEIIPGYLSRIHHELQNFRRGMGVEDPDPDGRLSFNSKDRTFSTVEREREVVRDMVFKPDDLVKSFDRMSDVSEALDIEKEIPEELRDEAQSTLSRHLMRESLDGKTMSLKRLSDPESFGDDVPPEISQAIADAVSKRYQTSTEVDESGNETFKSSKDRRDVSRLQNTQSLYRDIHEDVTNPRETIQALMQIGGEDRLRELGLLDYDRSGNTSINYDQIFRVYEQGGYDDAGGENVRDRRENRRYDRWFENKENQDQMQETETSNRRKAKEKKERREKTTLGRFVKTTQDALGNKTDQLQESVGLSRDPRYTNVERVDGTLSDRRLSDTKRQPYYSGKQKDHSLHAFYPSENIEHPSFVPVKEPEENVVDRVVDGVRRVGTTEGRRKLKQATIQRSKATYETVRDKEKRDDWLEGSKSQVSEQATKLRQKGDQAQSWVKNSELGQRATQGLENKTVKGAQDKVSDSINNIRTQTRISKALEDYDPDQTLSDEARESLEYQLKMELESGGKIDPEELSYSATYMNDIPIRTRGELAKHFAEFTTETNNENQHTSNLTTRDNTSTQQWVNDAKTNNSYRSTVERLVKKVYDPDLGVDGNVKKVQEQYGLSKAKAETIINTYITPTESPEEPVVPDVAPKLTDLTNAEDTQVRDTDSSTLRQKGDQARSYVKDKLSRFKRRKQYDDVDPTTAKSTEDLIFERIDAPKGNELLRQQRQQDVEDDSVKLMASSDVIGSFFKQIFGNGRIEGEYTPSSGVQTETTKDIQGSTGHVGRRPLEQLPTEEGGYFHRDSDVDGNVRPDVGFDTLGVGGDVYRDDVSPISLTDDNRPEVERETQGDQSSTLTDTLSSIRGILRGDEAGVSRNIQTLTDRLTVEGDVQADEAQLAVLSRILETVEAIGSTVAKGDEESWFNMLDIGKKTGRIMSKTAGAFGNFYLGGLNMLGGGMSGIGSALGGAGRMVGGLFGRKGKGGKGSAEIGTTDVYLKGQSTPVLEERVMEEGGYFDSETGGVISKVDDLSDLKGDVIDNEGNIVATAGELSKGLYDGSGKQLGGQSLASKIAGGVSRGAKGYLNATLSPARMLLNAPGKVMGTLGKLTNRVRDVYVKGESNPRLLATIMKNGGYASANTGRPIYSLKDLDGEVVDRRNNLIVSHDDIQQGLVDWKGEPFGFLDRQLNRIGGMVKAPLKAAKWSLGKARDAATWGTEKIGQLVGGLSSGFGSGDSSARAEEQGDEQLHVLKEIRDLIKAQKTSGEGRMWDTDGDGTRDNSWRELMEKDSDSEDDDVEEDRSRKEKDGSLMSTLLSLAGPIVGMLTTALGGVFSKFTGMFKDMFSMGAGGLGARLPGGRNRTPPTDPPSGRRGGLRSKAGKALKGLGKAATWFGRNVLWRGGAYVGSALVGALGWPVVLGGLAVGAVGAGAYFGYKHFFPDAPGELLKYRIMQYGLNPEDKNSVAKMLFLEDHLKDVVDVRGGGVKMDMDNFDIEKVAEELGVNTSDEEAVKHFEYWLKVRFFPVYAQARHGIAAIEAGKDLAKVDDLKANKRWDYFNVAKDPEDPAAGRDHPYAVSITPTGNSSITAEAIETEKHRIIRHMEEDEQREAVLGGKKEADKAIATLGDKDTRGIANQETFEQTSAPDSDDAAVDRIRQRVTQSQITKAKHTAITQFVEAYSKDEEIGRDVTPMDFVLYKTMGLKQLVPKKIAQLENLMKYMFRLIKKEPGKGYYWEGSVAEIEKKFSQDFGIRRYSKDEKRHRQDWRMWFKYRFIRVFLTFLNAIRSADTDPEKARNRLRDKPYLEQFAATKLAALQVDVDGEEMSVWDIMFSPWPGEIPLSDPSELDSLLRYIDGQVPGGDEDELVVPGDREIDSKTDEEEADLSREERQKKKQERAKETQRKSDNANQDLGTSHSLSSARNVASEQNTNLDKNSTNNSRVSGDNTKPPEGMTGSRPTTTVSRNDGYKQMVAGLAQEGIKDPEEQAMALAQMGHESAGFTATEENLNYGASNLRSVFGKYFNASEASSYARNPEAIANRVYGNRMGNTEPGDGWKYRGRGFIQLTGKDNYRRVSEATGIDYLSNPDLVSEPEHASHASLWWWKNRAGLRNEAQQGDVRGATKLINGGYNGLSDRQKRYNTHLPEAKEGKITREGVEAARTVAKGSSEEVEETPMETTALQSALQVGNQTSSEQEPTEDTSSEEGGKTSYRKGGVAKNTTPSPQSEDLTSLDSLDEESTKPTPRQSISTPASIDNSQGIDRALNRDPVQAQQDQERKERVQVVQDQEDRARNDSQNSSMSTMVNILENSLNTQRTMDGRLETITNLLRERDMGGDEVQKEISPTRNDPSENKKRLKKAKDLNVDPKEVKRQTIGITRRRSI